MPDFDRFARYYDADMGSFADDLPFYRELARRSDGPILDAMCGTGRVIVPLAQAGFQSVGLDIAPAMVAAVERKLTRRRLGERLRVVQGDIRSFELAERFGLILVPLNSFMHLETVDDQFAALRSIKRHLQPGGMLVLDLFNPDPRDIMADQGALVYEHTFTSAEGLAVQKYVVRRTDWAEQRQTVAFIYDELQADGRVVRSVMPFVMRWLYRFEVQHLLACVGLNVEAVYGDYDLEPYTSDSPQLIVTARGT
ncbi:MAG TPA: class I SAM-dependent methyltransferase [Herpetosiphonaceae bacterium]